MGGACTLLLVLHNSPSILGNAGIRGETSIAYHTTARVSEQDRDRGRVVFRSLAVVVLVQRIAYSTALRTTQNASLFCAV
jgi:hypothetical protein